jgi:hypothetical protein
MFSPSHRSQIASIVAILLLMPVLYPSFTAARVRTTITKPQDQQEKKQKEKSEKPQKDEKKTLTKQERKWLEIFRFSKQRYDSDPDFRMQVDEGYRKMQREHSEHAFEINTTDPRLAQVFNDKVRIDMNMISLYDNPLAQDYVNRVGQSLVPAGSDKLYAFKIMLNPIPEARSLSTGTIYVSTGLLASIENEAQLAYVLGHEIAHVDKEHWKDDVLVAEGKDVWNAREQEKEKKLGFLRLGVGMVAGQVGGGAHMVNAGTSIFFDAGLPTVFKLFEKKAVVSWDRQQEDQADEVSLHYMLNRKYDPREVPKFYAKLKGLSQRDKRASLGFIASAVRLAEREPYLIAMIGPMITAASNGSASQMLYVGAVSLDARRDYNQLRDSLRPMPQKKEEPGKALNLTANPAAREQGIQENVDGEHAGKIRELLETGELIGSSAEFQAVMAAIRRDNGIRAFQYDMFQMARENLEESIRIRSSDPYARFYYGKVLKLTARTLGEKQRALEEFALAIQLDKRKVLSEPYLHRALALIDSRESQTHEIIENLKQYVVLYQLQNAGSLPSNIDLIYDYMQDAGELSWTAIPAMNVSTKNIDPIGVTPSGQATLPTMVAPVNNQPKPASITQPQVKPSGNRRP